MEQILTKNGGKVDAVVASNDGTAGGVVAALTAKGMKGIPVSGQDGDHAALNRVALGTQTVSVWKDSRDLGRRRPPPPWRWPRARRCRAPTKWGGGEKKVALDSQFLKPVPITQDNLDVVVKAGWIKKDDAVQGRGRRQGARGLQVIRHERLRRCATSGARHENGAARAGHCAAPLRWQPGDRHLESAT